MRRSAALLAVLACGLLAVYASPGARSGAGAPVRRPSAAGSVHASGTAMPAAAAGVVSASSRWALPTPVSISSAPPSTAPAPTSGSASAAPPAAPAALAAPAPPPASPTAARRAAVSAPAASRSPAPSAAAPRAAAPSAAAAAAAAQPAKPAPAAPAPPAVPALVGALGSTGGASQLIVVTSSSWGSTYASLSAFQRTANGWQAVVANVPARVGRSGMSTHHREGDGSTPAGLWPVTEMFGIEPNPGVRFGYRRVDACSWWLEGSTPAPYYNTWQEIGSCPGARWPAFQPGWDTNPRDSEHLIDAVPAYEYAAVIGYNSPDVVGAPTPGLGSAIFLHVDEGSPTAGCVAIAQGPLLTLLRWLDPAQHPRIAIAPTSFLGSV